MISEFSPEQIQEMNSLIEYIELYKADGYNRLQIWKELRQEVSRPYILLEAFRKTGLFNG